MKSCQYALIKKKKKGKLDRSKFKGGMQDCYLEKTHRESMKTPLRKAEGDQGNPSSWPGTQK